MAIGVLLAISSSQIYSQQPTLKDAFAGKFHIGTALNAQQIRGKDTAAVRVIKSQFDAIVAENCMKMGPIHPKENVFDFSLFYFFQFC